MAKNKSDTEIQQTKIENTMNIIAKRCSYYRANPQRFVSEFLGLKLKLFQKILLYTMMHNDMYYFIAARGIGRCIV